MYKNFEWLYDTTKASHPAALAYQFDNGHTKAVAGVVAFDVCDSKGEQCVKRQGLVMCDVEDAKAGPKKCTMSDSWSSSFNAPLYDAKESVVSKIST